MIEKLRMEMARSALIKHLREQGDEASLGEKDDEVCLYMTEGGVEYQVVLAVKLI